MKLLILFVVIMILGYYSQDSTDFERERLVRKLRDMESKFERRRRGPYCLERATLWATLLTILVVVLTLMTIHHG